MAQTDVHLCLPLVLARMLGLSPRESEIVAIASELVDHASMHKGIKIYDLPKEFGSLEKKGLFEPICTAHNGIDMVNLLFPDPQEKVMIPFHASPDKVYLPELNERYDYRTKFNGYLIQEMIQKAIITINNAENQRDRDYGLVKLGIAFHTLADSMTHEGFSGRWHDENNISNLHLIDKPGKSLETNFLPNICHAEAGHWVDYSFPHYRFQFNESGEQVERNNVFRLLKLAKVMYDYLAQIKGVKKEKEFEEIRGLLKDCFRVENKDSDHRMKHWREDFEDISFKWAPRAWRNAAIGSELPFHPIESRKYRGVKRFQFQGDESSYLWLYFHIAAKEQREFVLDNIKRLE